MELLTKLFWTHGAVQAVLVLSAAIALGILLGRIRIGGVSFGIGGILFSGIILGHFGLSLDPAVLVFTREFGLILFVFAIGIQVGPTFLESLRDKGLKLNCMAVFIVLSGALLAALCHFAFDLSIPQMAGLFSGAVTNTPALGSASEAWSQVASGPGAVSDGLKTIGMAYAVAYPFGIFGIILTMMLLKGLFRIDVAAELARAATPHARQPATTPPGCVSGEVEVTRASVAGLRAGEALPAGVSLLALRRGGGSIDPAANPRLRLEDRLVVAAPDDTTLARVAASVGNNPRALDHPQMLSIFLGILAGVAAGSIPVAVPGLPTGVKLGVAGGTLLVAIFLSRIQRIGPLVWYMNRGANHLMREIGILLFLACVGLHAGGGFVETVIHGPGLAWMGMGAIITFVPLIAAALFSRLVWRIDYPAVCGMLAGSMTDPPALAFSMQYLGSEIPASSYSAVYPLTMILRILMGQLLVLVLAGV